MLIRSFAVHRRISAPLYIPPTFPRVYHSNIQMDRLCISGVSVCLLPRHLYATFEMGPGTREGRGLAPARGVTTFLLHKPIWTYYYLGKLSPGKPRQAWVS